MPPSPPPSLATRIPIHDARAGGLHYLVGPLNLTKNNTTPTLSVRSRAFSESDLDQRTVRSHISLVNFTEEKVRKLRMLTKETEAFHNAMHHSAIASRLASDFSDRSGLQSPTINFFV